MLDYGRRLLVVVILAVFIGLLFLGGSIGKATILDNQEWIWPAAGEISDHFGTRSGKHKGVDIAGNENTDVFAVSDGIVSKSYYSDTYGNVVFINHLFEGYETVYAHLNERVVHEGEMVVAGQLIGKMGNTGRSRGVHLHFEVHREKWTADKENALNPLVVFGEMKNQIVQASTPNQDKFQPDIAQKHIVKKGETLWSIGEFYGVSIETLLVLNNLNDPNQIVEGQVIHIKVSG